MTPRKKKPTKPERIIMLILLIVTSCAMLFLPFMEADIILCVLLFWVAALPGRLADLQYPLESRIEEEKLQWAIQQITKQPIWSSGDMILQLTEEEATKILREFYSTISTVPFERTTCLDRGLWRVARQRGIYEAMKEDWQEIIVHTCEIIGVSYEDLTARWLYKYWISPEPWAILFCFVTTPYWTVFPYQFVFKCNAHPQYITLEVVKVCVVIWIVLCFVSSLCWCERKWSWKHFGIGVKLS